ncbi:S9 family peptidase [Halovivax gelatinilyticus]|uniref:S9 family peptidase n=1 Tax=Halovivax gelatinilyticus TaxID=2961597 RepID=UPI0020CA833B|nr:S9 family peptidase [Halovivax gelatinilyticus]
MQPIDAADYHDLVHVADPQLSPDGERVAYVRKVAEDDESYAATIYVVPTAGGEPRQFTVAEGVDSQPRWSPDGSYLAFVSTRGADDDRPQLWILPTDGGEAQQVTEVAGGVTGIEWSPDGSRIVFTQAVTAEDRDEGRDFSVDADYEPESPDPRVIDRLVYRSMQQYYDGKRSHVYVLDVEAALAATDATGPDEPSRADALVRLTDGDADYVGPGWGDAETVYYASKEDHEEPDDAVTFDIYEHPVGSPDDGADADAADPEVFTQTTGWGGMIEATSDGLVAFPRVPEDRMSMRQVDIVVHDRETGDEVVPTEPLDRTLGFGGFEWGPDEERLFFATPDDGSVVVHSVPGDASDPPEPIYDQGVTVEGVSIGEESIAVAQSEWSHPGDVFVADRDGGEPRRLTTVNESYLSSRAVAEPEELRYENDGVDLQGWLLLPPADVEPADDQADESDTDAAVRIGDEPYPLVVEIHGGPHTQWTTSGTMWHEFQTLAASGYAVFWSNPRGSTGYGEDHAMGIYRDWGDVTLSDVLAGADLVCERPEVDETEQFVTGGSFGGYMTAWTVGSTDRFTAAVSQRGVYDLTGFYGSTDGAFKLVEYDFGTTPWEEPEFLWEHSPTSLVPEVDTPTLLIHSDRDYRTPANTAELFYVGLKKHRVDTRLVRYPREGHELSRSGEPAHVVDRIERIRRWFDGYSEHFDDPPALERDPNDGLSAGEGDEDENDDTEDDE